VFPALPAGDYVVWQDTAAAAGTITIHGGQVTSFRLGASDMTP
jgi:glycerol-3-phosphate dehydrogenase